MSFANFAADFYQQFQKAVVVYWKHFAAMLPRILFGILLLLIFVLIANGLYRLIRKALEIRSVNRLTAPFVSRMAKWFFIAAAVMFTFNLMGFTGLASGLLAGASISAFIIGFALKDIGENFLAGLILVFNRNFHVGDILKIDNYTGKVISINMRSTRIRTFEGNDVFIPNSNMINNVMVNVTATGLTRHDFTIGIDYHDDIQKAFSVIYNSIKDIDGVLRQPGPFVNVDSFSTNVLLRIYYWYNSIEYEKSAFFLDSEVKRAVKECLMSNGFHVPSK